MCKVKKVPAVATAPLPAAAGARGGGGRPRLNIALVIAVINRFTSDVQEVSKISRAFE